jgi:hypothetical protein
MDATLFPPKETSVWRQGPIPELDALWAELEFIRAIVIVADETRKLGKDPEIVATLEHNIWHLGDNTYIAATGILQLF